MTSAKKKRKIAYVSGTRADFGLMTPVLHKIVKSRTLDLLLYATGMHLMPEFGSTIREVQKEFPQVKAIDALFTSDDPRGRAEFAGAFLSKVVSAFAEATPEVVLTLGDRPEMLCAAAAALYLGIPSGQIHGGEKTATVDEITRHAVTKLSHLHFPATRESARRIEKMGEERWRIEVVGAPALDVILHETLPTREELFRALGGIDSSRKIILLTQHPVSEEYEKAGEQMEEVIRAVKEFSLPVVAIFPNADPGGRAAIAVLKKEERNPSFHLFPSLPHTLFLTLEREAAVWVGNSSAALIESAAFRTPVVNVGIRQLGRQQTANVLDVPCKREAIRNAITTALSDARYRRNLAKVKNPWGDGRASERIVNALERLEINAKLLEKRLTY